MSLDKKYWMAIKAGVFLLSLLPFILLFKAAFQDQLGANPVQALHHGFGDWTLRFICIGLVLTPYKKITGQSWPMRFRRMMGLFAFFYATLHFLAFTVLDLSCSWAAFKDEVPESPYILMRLLTFFLMIPLAVTSTKAMQKRLGANWRKLHRLVYVIAITALIHYFWLVKADYSQPLVYALILFLLLACRALLFLWKKNKQNQYVWANKYKQV
ncbi:protein-methionine-sulfoxide reductase heme-binding subunit MsrQ [Methylobacter luteus]|uniref:sulfite oxidase heme-binding subunit YedZ n=1 Tax=Methylobacter luteus TaxID=415 RepID=UPI000423F992|nr:protein-methionine-sulfoxide reductase heme-binding subunit MsrQ [Methylobacter luteus]